MTQVKRVKLVLQAPLDYLALHPCSHRTQECQESKGPKERRVILACLGNRDCRAIPENWGLGDPLERRVPKDRKAHAAHPDQLETPALLEL